MLDRPGDVLLALAQRGDAERRDRHPVEQVLAKTTGSDVRPEIPVGRGDQLELNVARLAGPERIQLSAFENAQEVWLQLQRHLADLVEKQRPAACRLDFPDHPGAPGSREGTIDITEQLAPHEITPQAPRTQR